MQVVNQKELADSLLNEGCLIDAEVIQDLKIEDVKNIKEMAVKPMIVNYEFLLNLRKLRPKVLIQQKSLNLETSVEMEEYRGKESKKTTEDFANQFTNRYESLRNILMRRQELKSCVSISNINFGRNEEVSVIGIVNDKNQTKKGKFILDLEDPTGHVKVLVSEELGENIVSDEVIGIVGKTGNDIVFSQEILWPDIPFTGKSNRTKDEVYAAFFSDTHFGSKYLLEKKVQNFLKWINTKNNITDKIGYLFLTGDLVDGIGKYPGQRKALALLDIYKQYEALEDFLLQIPERIQNILIPGDHDVVRMGEPQPRIPQEFLPKTKNMNNIHFTSNPSYVNIHIHDNPVSVLLYHGYSYYPHINLVPSLRRRAEIKPTEVLKDLLKRRHLSPTYGNIQLYPEKKDHHIIGKVPDIFAIGQLHTFDYSIYKGVNLICSSTFQGQTAFTERLGTNVYPGKVFLLNLRTRTSLLKLI